jgi:hypothetical protein
VNAPQSQDDGSTDPSIESAGRVVLRSTKWAGHRSGAFERTLYRVHAALRPLIVSHLSQEHAFLFAEPVPDQETGEVHWYSPVEGAAVAYNELAPEDQAALGQRVNQLLFDLLELARTLQAKATTKEEYVAGELLQMQLDSAFPETDYLFVVGFQPVVAFWAFEPDRPPDTVVAEAPEALAEEPIARAAAQGEAGPLWPVQAPSPRIFGIVAAVLALVFFGVFGLNPRETVVSWLDRVETIKAREQALLREIVRIETRAEGAVAPEDLEKALMSAEVAAAKSGAVVPADADKGIADEGFYEPEEEPIPAFQSTEGTKTLASIPGSVVILHFWDAADEKACAEITSFVSMVGSDRFEALREQGGEAYLVTAAKSVQKGSELLRQCGVDDPFLLRDPDGQILARLSPGTGLPVTIVYDKEDERVLASMSRRNWEEPKSWEELRQLFLMRVF